MTVSNIYKPLFIKSRLEGRVIVAIKQVSNWKGFVVTVCSLVPFSGALCCPLVIERQHRQVLFTVSLTDVSFFVNKEFGFLFALFRFSNKESGLREGSIKGFT